jgi:hypothetical protein
MRGFHWAHSVGGETVLKVLLEVRVGCWRRVYLSPFACALASCPFLLGAKL